MNQIHSDIQDGVGTLLQKANQIRSNAERMLAEASALEELRRLLQSSSPEHHSAVQPPRTEHEPLFH